LSNLDVLIRECLTSIVTNNKR